MILSGVTANLQTAVVSSNSTLGVRSPGCSYVRACGSLALLLPRLAGRALIDVTIAGMLADTQLSKHPANTTPRRARRGSSDGMAEERRDSSAQIPAEPSPTAAEDSNTVEKDLRALHFISEGKGADGTEDTTVECVPAACSLPPLLARLDRLISS